MQWRLFRALDDEWRALIRTHASEDARVRWADDAVLSRLAHPAAIVEFLRAGVGDPAGKNRLLAALARRAPSDDFAMRTMLQALLPGLVNVAKRLARGAADDELEAQVLTEAVDRIRHYPLERRPRSVAANVTLDVFGTIVRDRTRRRAASPRDVVGLPPDGGDPSVEVVELVSTAWSQGRLATGDAQLLLSVAVGTDTLRRRAEREGVSYGAMTERWRRARDRLRRAVLDRPSGSRS
jgi:hypothetical protein